MSIAGSTNLDDITATLMVMVSEPFRKVCVCVSPQQSPWSLCWSLASLLWDGRRGSVRIHFAQPFSLKVPQASVCLLEVSLQPITHPCGLSSCLCPYL